MPWFPDIAGPAFCETLHLRKIILEQQRPAWTNRNRVLEPGSAEFISALAAGSNSKKILHVGCGLSTIALAAAARATGGCLECVDTDREKQAIVYKYVMELGLHDYAEFYVEKPGGFIEERDSFDFVLLTGDPESYIEYFDLLRFTRAAIIVAYNALDEATNEYIKHVRQQPGIDSSTLPVGRGIEVSKILSWDAFNSGRRAYRYSEICEAASENEYNENVNTNLNAAPPAYVVRSAHNYFPGASSETHDFRHPEEDDFNGSVYGSLTTSSSNGPVGGAAQGISIIDEGIVSPSVSVGTSLEEDGVKIHAVSEEEELRDDIFVMFTNVGFETEIKVVGPDRQMLLADISLALNEAKVSVQGAKISTNNDRIEDVFYVVDTESKQQLDLDQQELVRSKILNRLKERTAAGK